MFHTIRIKKVEAITKCPTECIQKTFANTWKSRYLLKGGTTWNNLILRLVYNMGQTVLLSNTFSTQYLIAVTRASLHGESWWKQSLKHLLWCVKRQIPSVFFTGHKIYFFCLGFVSAGKGRGYYFSSSVPLPPASQIVQSSAFAFIGEV